MPVQAGQSWSVRAKVRAPLITRVTSIKALFGFIFYNASGAAINASTYLSEFDIFDKSSWKTVENVAVAPEGLYGCDLYFKT